MSVAMPIIGAVIGVGGAISAAHDRRKAARAQHDQQVKQQAMQDEFDRKVLEQKAKTLESEALEINLQGRSRAQAIRSGSDEAVGSIVSGAAGSGVMVNTGSVLDLIEESAFNIEMDALTVEDDAKRSSSSRLLEARSAREAKPDGTTHIPFSHGASGLSTMLSVVGSGLSGYAKGTAISAQMDG
jgi:hypothetical protein